MYKGSRGTCRITAGSRESPGQSAKIKEYYYAFKDTVSKSPIV